MPLDFGPSWVPIGPPHGPQFDRPEHQLDLLRSFHLISSLGPPGLPSLRCRSCSEIGVAYKIVGFQHPNGSASFIQQHARHIRTACIFVPPPLKQVVAIHGRQFHRQPRADIIVSTDNPPLQRDVHMLLRSTGLPRHVGIPIANL